MERPQTGVGHLQFAVPPRATAVSNPGRREWAASEEFLSPFLGAATPTGGLPVSSRWNDPYTESAYASHHLISSWKPEVCQVGTRNADAVLGGLAMQQAFPVIYH